MKAELHRNLREVVTLVGRAGSGFKSFLSDGNWEGLRSRYQRRVYRQLWLVISPVRVAAEADWNQILVLLAKIKRRGLKKTGLKWWLNFRTDPLAWAYSVRLRKALLSGLLSLILIFSPIGTVPITLASDITWDGEAGDGQWNNPVNWSGDVVPGPNDVVVFDGSHVSGVTIDGTVDVRGVIIEEGFGAQIGVTPNSNVTIGQDGWRQSGGRFLGGSGNLTLAGSLTLLGGEFVAPASKFYVGGNLAVFATNSFKHNGGTVILDGRNQVLFGHITFNDLAKETEIQDTLELQSGKSYIIDGDLKLSGAAFTPGGKVDENYLVLRSSETGVPAVVEKRGLTAMSYLTVRDVINIAL